MEEEILLKVKDLKLHFQSGKQVIKAVDGVSFSIRKGEVFGLVGESGSGKTTTGRSIVGLYEITGGRIEWKGKEIANGDKKRRKKRKIQPEMQMIFQDPVASLDPRMTVRDIVAEGLYIRGERDRKAVDEKVFQMLALVGLTSEHAGRYPHEFSGGQRQRIGIARALVMRPEMIIADEPVSALDVSVQAQVINLMNDLKEQFSLTVLFIAHDLSVVKYFSDRIGVMYAGKIVELASAKELFKNPLHPYTKALLSAVPLPDPKAEKKRKRIFYDGKGLDGDAVLREITIGHFVYCTDEEEREMKEKNDA